MFDSFAELFAELNIRTVFIDICADFLNGFALTARYFSLLGQRKVLLLTITPKATSFPARFTRIGIRLTSMKAIEVVKDIAKFDSDALVYSTNQNLHLTGGVGASLLNCYGNGIQRLLDAYLSTKGVSEVKVGTILEGRLESMPWRRVFHTVATDLNYHTDASIVESIIREVLQRCEIDYSIKSIVFSALGSGYGSLTFDNFLAILNDQLRDYHSETFTVYVANNI